MVDRTLDFQQMGSPEDDLLMEDQDHLNEVAIKHVFSKVVKTNATLQEPKLMGWLHFNGVYSMTSLIDLYLTDVRIIQ